MTETTRCPYCGAPDSRSAPGHAVRGHDDESAGSGARGASPDPLRPLYEEVRRIREIAQAREGDDARRISELTREVGELRATVARLRGGSGAAVTRVG